MLTLFKLESGRVFSNFSNSYGNFLVLAKQPLGQLSTNSPPPSTPAETERSLDRSRKINTIQYNITLLPSVNTLIARGMYCGAKYTHDTFTPIIKHLITTANKHPVKKSFIDKNMRKSHWNQAVHNTVIKLSLPEDPS